MNVRKIGIEVDNSYQINEEVSRWKTQITDQTGTLKHLNTHGGLIPSNPPFFIFLPLVSLTGNWHVMFSLLGVHAHSLSSNWQRPSWGLKCFNIFMWYFICVFHLETSSCYSGKLSIFIPIFIVYIKLFMYRLVKFVR